MLSSIPFDSFNCFYFFVFNYYHGPHSSCFSLKSFRLFSLFLHFLGIFFSSFFREINSGSVSTKRYILLSSHNLTPTISLTNIMLWPFVSSKQDDSSFDVYIKLFSTLFILYVSFLRAPPPLTRSKNFWFDLSFTPIKIIYNREPGEVG